MPRYSALVLKIVCLGAAVGLLLQLSHWFNRREAMANIRIPEVPTITNALNATTTASTGKPSASSTNTSGRQPTTNTHPRGVGSNAVAGISATNATIGMGMTATAAVAQVNTPGTNSTATATTKTNATTAGGGTNAILGQTSTNMSSAGASPATNAAAMVSSGPIPGAVQPGVMPGAPNRPPRMGPAGGPAAELPPIVKARVDRIIDSEILGPVARPMPMALLGIAGQDVFLRAPNGQTGLVREGNSLGGVKLMKIGTNRVLVEEDGETKELMIFSGIGGETLMSITKTNHP